MDLLNSDEAHAFKVHCGGNVYITFVNGEVSSEIKQNEFYNRLFTKRNGDGNFHIFLDGRMIGDEKDIRGALLKMQKRINPLGDILEYNDGIVNLSYDI